jgi:hypothetical protein
MQFNMFRQLAVCFALIVVGLPFSARGAIVVQNGSLEDLNSQFVNTSANYMSLLAGATAIADWTVSGGTTNEIVWGKSPTGDGHNAAAGTFFVDLTGFGGDSPNGAIEQTLLNLLVGQSYAFSIDVEASGPLPLVTVGGTAVSLSAGTPFTVGSDIWTPETGSFIAGSASPLLKIANQQPGQAIDFIDNVMVTGPTSVPEPAGLQLLVSGLVFLVVWRHHRLRRE